VILALAVKPPGQDHTIGFGASTEPWAPENAFASADDAAAVALPPGITIVRSDEVNEIDLAADAEAKTLADNTVGVSLITPARAAPPPPEPEEPQPQASWLSWAYGKLVDGVLAAVLAVRSVFV
jgi:hypothetical protein